MQNNIFQEIYQTKKPSIFGDLLPNIKHLQRSNSNPSSNINTNSKITNYDNLPMENNHSNDSSKFSQNNNPINLHKNENENMESSSETNKTSFISQFNIYNTQICPNFLNFNIYGFKGRSPYASPNLNNIINNNPNNVKSINVSKNSNNNKTQKINQKQNQNQNNKNQIGKNQNNKTQNNKNQKKNEAALITQLKDKVLEYRCSVCNFVTNENEELHKHLTIKKHYTFPKKAKKFKNKKLFYKNENKINQTFIYSMTKIKKNNYDNRIFCRHCGKKFESKHGLNAHLNAHKYKCEKCYRLFNSKEELMRHHNCELIYNNKKTNTIFYKNKEYKSPGKKKTKMEIDEWDEISSNKKEKWESDEEINKYDFEQSYAFIEEDDENYDFNKMVKINDKRI